MNSNKVFFLKGKNRQRTVGLNNFLGNGKIHIACPFTLYSLIAIAGMKSSTLYIHSMPKLCIENENEKMRNKFPGAWPDSWYNFMSCRY